MEATLRETTSQKVERALKEQGRKKKWLAEQLGVNPMTISHKIRDNTWSVAELFLLQSLLNIE